MRLLVKYKTVNWRKGLTKCNVILIALILDLHTSLDSAGWSIVNITLLVAPISQGIFCINRHVTDMTVLSTLLTHFEIVKGVSSI